MFWVLNYVFDNYVLRLNHVQSNSLTHQAVFGGLSFWRWLNSKLTPSSTRSLKTWQNEWSTKWSMPPMTKRIWTLPARKLTIVFKVRPKRFGFFQSPTKYIKKYSEIPNQHKMTRWIKISQIFPNKPFFRRFFHPKIWESLTGIFGQRLPCNSWLVRFGCRRPADEAIQRSTFQLCEARPRDN